MKPSDDFRFWLAIAFCCAAIAAGLADAFGWRP